MKTLLVYVHLIAACVAVGILLIQDLALAKTGGKPMSVYGIEELKRAARIISLALIVLWVSGVTLVIVGYINSPEEYLMNQKLWAKFTVVAVLTLNGVVLHHFSFPRVASSRGIAGLGKIEKFLVMLTGCISTTSWLFACYLGIARSWNYTVDYSFVMFVYLGLLGIACILGSTVVSNRTILGLGNVEKLLVVLCGSISTFSWLFACYLGIAHTWSHTDESRVEMFVNLGLLGAACIIGCVLMHSLCASKDTEARRNNEEQPMLPESISLANSISKT
jgi:hypothetical protein